MSKLITEIATKASYNYKISAPKETFFGFDVTPKINIPVLQTAIDHALSWSKLDEFESFVKNREEFEEEFEKQKKEENEAFVKKQAKFEEELKEANEEFRHQLNVAKIQFEREQELKRLEMEHNEQVFVSESKFTKDFIESELKQARSIHEREIATQIENHKNEMAIKEAQFTAEIQAATELAQNEIAHAKAIAAAEVDKAKQVSQINYTYDATVLSKKIQSEVAERYDELLAIANKYQAAQELIEKLESDKAYFQNFAEARVDRSEDVTDKLIDKIGTKECKPVTVNVTEVKAKK